MSDCVSRNMNSSSSKIHPYVCNYESCNASFSKKSKLVYHMGRHTGQRPFVCQEENCHKSYTNPAHLRRHKKVSHCNLKPEPIICPYEGCSLILANKYSLKKHCNIKHNPNRQYPFECKECGKGFFRKRQLLQHSYLHTGIPPFKCETCDARFLTLVDCNRHKRTHTIYICECKEKFERWTSLLAHKRSCEIARPKCTECNRTFSNPSNLKLHIEAHLRKAQKNTYHCTYENCSRSYMYKRNLYYHIDTYHKKIQRSKIPCTFPNCEQKFSKQQHLKNHLEKIHTERKGTPKPRKPRKDKGIPKTSFAAKLAGLNDTNCIPGNNLVLIPSEKDLEYMEDNCDGIPIDTNFTNIAGKDELDISQDNLLDEIHFVPKSLNFVKFIS